MIFLDYTYLLPSPNPEFFQIYQANSSESSIMMPPSSRNSSPPAVVGEVKVNQSCITLCNPMDYTGVGSHSLLQGIFPTQGSNPGHQHGRRILYQLSHQGSLVPSAFIFSVKHFSSERSSLIALSTVKVKSEVAQSCPTLCDPVDCSPPGSSLHGILQARVLEWVPISLSRGSSRPRDLTQVSCIAGRRFNLWATREALR